MENSLRSHWTDEQVRRRDGEPRHQAHFQEEGDEVSEPEADPDEAYFENWSDQEVAWWQEARSTEHQAWLQYQHARRTLKDARARQHEVKMGRHFYRPKGNGKGKSTPVGANPRHGPCLKCGGSHATAACPGNNRQDAANYGTETTEDATFYQEMPEQPVFTEDAAHAVPEDKDDPKTEESTHRRGGNDYQQMPEQPETNFQDFTENAFHAVSGSTGTMQLEPGSTTGTKISPTLLTTAEAVRQGMAVLDGGATRTMASAYAIEQLAAWNRKHFNNSGIVKVDTTEQPTFGFGNSEMSRCISTCYVAPPNTERAMNYKVHVIDKGTAPVLLSVETLRKMGAIIDYTTDQAVFTKIDPNTLVQLKRSQAGHQLLPLGEDVLSGGRRLSAPVWSLGGSE